MTIVTSKTAASIDALVALATAYFGAFNGTNTLVVDGPYNDQNGDQLTAKSRLFIGADTADPDGEAVAVSGEQNFRNTGTQNRLETWTINCAATGIDGNNSMTVARGYAQTVLAGVETILRGTNTSPVASNISNTVLYSEVGPVEIIQSLTDGGAYCELRFGVRCTAYLNQV